MPESLGTLHLDGKLLLAAGLGKFLDNIQILSDGLLDIGNGFCLGFSLGVASWEPWNGHSKPFVRFVNDDRIFHSVSPNRRPTEVSIAVR